MVLLSLSIKVDYSWEFPKGSLGPSWDAKYPIYKILMHFSLPFASTHIKFCAKKLLKLANVAQLSHNDMTSDCHMIAFIIRGTSHFWSCEITQSLASSHCCMTLWKLRHQRELRVETIIALNAGDWIIIANGHSLRFIVGTSCFFGIQILQNSTFHYTVPQCLQHFALNTFGTKYAHTSSVSYFKIQLLATSMLLTKFQIIW